MRIGYTLPPAASPLSLIDLFNGISGIISPDKNADHLRNSIWAEFSKKHSFFLSSGKAALTITLKALSKLNPDCNEVVIPAFDCYSVPSAITRAGLIIRPCEINPSTLDFDKQALADIIDNSNKILAIVPTDLFGLPADISHIRTLIDNKPIYIIEDAAQAMGSRHSGRYLGTSGDVGIFSLARGKALSAGEGGIIITDSNEIADTISIEMKTIPEYSFLQLTNLIIQTIALTLLIHPYIFWLPKSLPFLKLGETLFDTTFSIQKFSRFQAGLSRHWRKKLEWLCKERSMRVRLYMQQFNTVNGISMPSKQFENSDLSCIRFPIIINNPVLTDTILQTSDKLGLGIAKTYPASIATLDCARSTPAACPSAQSVIQSMITLPCHPMVSENDIKRIVFTVRSIIERQ